MKTNVTVIEISDILSFADKNLKICWNQAHEDIKPFIQSVYEKPLKFLIEYDDLFTLNSQGKFILDEFIKQHNLNSTQEILVIK